MFSVCYFSDFKITLHWPRQKAGFIQCGTEVEARVACDIAIDGHNLRKLSQCHQPITCNRVFNTDAYISSRPKEQMKKLSAGEAWCLTIFLFYLHILTLNLEFKFKKLIFYIEE